MKLTSPENIEAMAAVVHEQWTVWSREVATDVNDARRERWAPLWVPYCDLPEEVKALHRRWALRYMAALAEKAVNGL